MPLPTPTPVNLVDESVELNQTTADISFKAEYDISGNITILYMHNYPGNLTFSTSTIGWAPF